MCVRAVYLRLCAGCYSDVAIQYSSWFFVKCKLQFCQLLQAVTSHRGSVARVNVAGCFALCCESFFYFIFFVCAAEQGISHILVILCLLVA